MTWCSRVPADPSYFAWLRWVLLGSLNILFLKSTLCISTFGTTATSLSALWKLLGQMPFWQCARCIWHQVFEGFLVVFNMPLTLSKTNADTFLKSSSKSYRHFLTEYWTEQWSTGDKYTIDFQIWQGPLSNLMSYFSVKNKYSVQNIIGSALCWLVCYHGHTISWFDRFP